MYYFRKINLSCYVVDKNKIYDLLSESENIDLKFITLKRVKSIEEAICYLSHGFNVKQVRLIGEINEFEILFIPNYSEYHY